MTGGLRKTARGAVLILLAAVLAGLALEGALQVAARLTRPRRGEDPALLATAPIVVYGDSTPFGLGNTVAFPAEIARRTSIPVANRSWPALNSTQVARIVHEDMTHATPRVVLVMAGVNDGWNLEDVPGPLLGEAARWYDGLPRLRILRLLTIGIEAGLGRNEYESATGLGWGRREETARLLRTAEVRRILEGSFRRIRSDASAQGAEVLFLGYQAEGYNHVGDLAEDVLRTEHADRFVPMRDLFWQEGERRMIQPDNFHPTDEGQQEIATRVIAALESRGWLADLLRPDAKQQ
jgi:lysophospholipase L1-like esterase